MDSAEINKRYKPFDELTLRDDYMFAIIMRRKEFCIPFLEMLLNIKIKDVKYSDSQVSIDTESDAKSIRLDVYVDDGKGSVYDIEMQNTKPKYIGKRFRYYQSVIDTKNLNKGMSYDDLKKSYIIFICTFDAFGKNLPIYTFRNIAEESNDVVLDDEAYKIVLNSTAYKQCDNQGISNFLNYLETGISVDEYTTNLDKAISKTHYNRERREQYMTFAQKMYEEFSEGRAEGKTEGIIFVLKGLLEDDMITIEDAAKRANMSVEDLQTKLKEFNQ